MSVALCFSPWILGRVLCKWDWLGAAHILSTCPKFHFPKDTATGDSDKWEHDVSNYIIITYNLIKVFLCVSSFCKIIPGFFTANSIFFFFFRSETICQHRNALAAASQSGGHWQNQRRALHPSCSHLQPHIRKCCNANLVSGSQANKSVWDVALGYSKWAVVSKEYISMEADFGKI